MLSKLETLLKAVPLKSVYFQISKDMGSEYRNLIITHRSKVAVKRAKFKKIIVVKR